MVPVSAPRSRGHSELEISSQSMCVPGPYLDTSSPKYFSEISASVPSARRSARALSTALISESLPVRNVKA
jgi:hypothetical protein